MSHTEQGQSKKQKPNDGTPAILKKIEAYIDASTAETKNRKMKPYEKWNLFLTVMTILVGTIVAVIYYKQLKEMQESIDVTREHFVLDQRPYVGLAPAPQNTPVRMGPVFDPPDRAPVAISWNSSLKNIGKSIALNVRVTRYIELGGSTDKRAGIPILRHGERPPRSDEETTPPNWLFPGEEQWMTAHSIPIDAQRFTQLTQIDGGIVLSGRITYEDRFGDPYATPICIALQANRALWNCADTKDLK